MNHQERETSFQIVLLNCYLAGEGKPGCEWTNRLSEENLILMEIPWPAKIGEIIEIPGKGKAVIQDIQPSRMSTASHFILTTPATNV